MPAVFKRYSVSFQAEIINLEIQSIVTDGTLLLSPSVSTVTVFPPGRGRGPPGLPRLMLSAIPQGLRSTPSRTSDSAL